MKLSLLLDCSKKGLENGSKFRRFDGKKESVFLLKPFFLQDIFVLHRTPSSGGKMKLKKSVFGLILLLLMTLAGCEHQESRLISYNGNYLNDEGAYYSASENTTSILCLDEENTVDDIEEAKESIYVSILGEVSSPGVYVMPEGSRTYELINEAGGATENADTARLNLVSLLEDGMQITVPSYEADQDSPAPVVMGNPESEGSKRSLVNINTASVSELTTLTGIGTTRAEAIINYRDSVGGFEKCEDLMNVTGIKQGIYDKLKDEICTR